MQEKGHGEMPGCVGTRESKNETELGGWQLNKQIIGYYRGEKLPLLFDKMDQAEYIDMPDKPGYLELQIGVGVLVMIMATKQLELRDDINESTMGPVQGP